VQLNQSSWKFADFFDTLDFERASFNKGIIEQARTILLECDISNHEFFVIAEESAGALKVWAAQEAVITNHFSQVLLRFLSQMKNVHVRSLLMPVVAGEHSRLKDGVAFGSHPNLLAKLVLDLGLAPHDIKPMQCTIEFGNELNRSADDWYFGLGFLGIGNEAMLVPEYEAIEKVFSMHFEREIFRPFLRANIEEDKSHSDLMDQAAMLTIQNSEEATKFLAGAEAGVLSRRKYYDRLVTEIGQL
jgi:hypothetical protein